MSLKNLCAVIKNDFITVFLCKNIFHSSSIFDGRGIDKEVVWGSLGWVSTQHMSEN